MAQKSDSSSRRARFEIATINGETGQMQRAKPAQRPKKMPLKLLKEALEGLQLIPLNDDTTLTPYVTLSPQTPYAAGKGWLEAIHARTFFAANPSMSWIPEAGQITGFLDVWLDGLAPNTLYIAQVEIGSIGAGPFEIQAVTLGVNWYLNPHTRIMFNYVHSNFEDGAIDDDLDAFMMRFQVDF